MSWKSWAEEGLQMMDEQGVDDQGARCAFEQVAFVGAEPYYTLKGVYWQLKTAADKVDGADKVTCTDCDDEGTRKIYRPGLKRPWRRERGVGDDE